jgi:hypothetical protein
MTFQNLTQTSTTTYSFDVYLTNVQSANTLQLRSFQWGLNTTGWTSGSFTNTLAYVAGSRDALYPAGAPAYSVASQAKTSTGLTPTVSFSHLRLTSNSITTGSEPVLQPNVPFKLGSFTVTLNNASLWTSNYNPFNPPVFGTGAVQAIQTLVATGYSQAIANVLVNGLLTSYSAANSLLSTTMTPSPSGASPFLLNAPTCTNTTSSQPATACNSYTWAANGQTYTATGAYTYTSLIGAGPCINTATLNLVINNNTSSSSSQTACNSYTWAANNTTYTTSGIYTFTNLNANNCTNTQTLNLTINNSSTSSQSATSCNTYTWTNNGQTYTASGAYTATSLNGSG